MDGFTRAVVGGIVSGTIALVVWKIEPGSLGVVTLAVAIAILLRHGGGDR